MTTRSQTFGISVGSIFATGIRGFLANPIPIFLAGAATIGVYLAFRIPAQAAADEGRLIISLALDLTGLVVASVVSYPWYSYALAAGDGKPVDVAAPFRSFDRFTTQAVASFWFWAGVLLGVRYLYGIPAIVALLFYAFYGYVIADGVTLSGLKALGHSARLGEGKRVGMFAIGALLFAFNFFGAIAIGFTLNALTIALAVIGFTITASITLVGGAAIYRTFSKALEQS